MPFQMGDNNETEKIYVYVDEINKYSSPKPLGQL